MQTFNQPLTGPTGPPGVPSSFGTTLLLLQVREPDPGAPPTRPPHLSFITWQRCFHAL